MVVCRREVVVGCFRSFCRTRSPSTAILHIFALRLRIQKFRFMNVQGFEFIRVHGCIRVQGFGLIGVRGFGCIRV